MRRYLKKLPDEARDLLFLIGDMAFVNNVRAYLVGGCVRDLLLAEKNLDLDIVIEGNGIKFAEELAGAFNTKLTRHKRFGTATLEFLNHRLKIDIATARKEFYPQPAHLPVVEPGSLKDDLRRRDFSINAMAVSINKDGFGELIDLFGGMKDLKNKKIRILHGLSFIDDPTRILRAIRFEQRYGFKIEPQTLKFLRKTVALFMLEKVEPQRIRDDLILILKEKAPLKVIKRLKKLTGFNFISPGLRIGDKSLRLLGSVEKQINWFKKAYPQRRILDTWVIYLMALLDALDVNSARKAMRKFVLRKGEDKRVLGYKKIGRKFTLDLKKAKNKPSKIFSLLEPLSYEVILLIKAKYKDSSIQCQIEDFFEIYNGMKIYSSGHDLRSLGLAPGPYYQKIFTKVLNAKLNGLVKTKEEELELIKGLILNK